MSSWGFWALPFLAAGAAALRETKTAARFACVFLPPLALTVATGIVGFPRIYIYWTPFVLMLGALGIVKAVSCLKKLQPATAYALAALVATGLLFETTPRLSKYYSSRSRVPAATIAEAKQVSSYIQTEVSRDRLVALLLPSETTVLNRYLADWLRETMYGIFQGNEPSKIIFVSYGDSLSRGYSAGGYYAGSFLKFPADSVKPIKSIGNLRIHEFNKNISRFIPSARDPDYETRLEISSSQAIVVESSGDQKVLGSKSLVLTKKESKDLMLNSPAIKTIDIKKGAYILTIYARKYGQKSKAVLAEYNPSTWPPPIAYLNPYFGEFSVRGLDFNWQMVFIISPVSVGRHNLTEIFHLQDAISYFDGLQSYILY